MLNDSTRMTFDHNDPRFAVLSSGEALFRVHHDSARPFKLYVGGVRVDDVGTVFDVIREEAQVRVAVAEGKVVYHSSGRAIALQAGQALVEQSGSGAIRLTRASIASVGAWQNGQLVYSGEPLSRVAADLGRLLGVRIVTSPSIADRPFFGSIAVAGNPGDELKRLEKVLNVALKGGPDEWTLTPVDDGAR
jgi:transmembrane sensor